MSEHTGKTISVEEADRFLAEIRALMKQHGLNFGPACELWAKKQAWKKEQKDGTT